MKILIDLDDLKEFINTLDSDKDEWYGRVDYMTGHCILEFLEWNKKTEMAKEFEKFIYGLHED